MPQQKFVLVICGKKAYIDMLNHSLIFLRHFSNKEIIVLTDTGRNEGSIEHDTIINVNVPSHLTNKEASRYLKTSLYQWLDMRHTYCYLDADIFVIDEKIDSIFDYRAGVIQFVQDIAPISVLSNYTVFYHDDKQLQEKEKTFLKRYESTHKKRLPLAFLKKKKGTFQTINQSNNQSRSSSPLYKWLYQAGLFFYKNINRYDLVTKGYWFDPFRNCWRDFKGNFVYSATSPALPKRIKETFGVEVTDNNWQVWNGGLFLFDQKSIDFLKTWHQWSMEIFSNPNWQIRDMGTLSAAIWAFNIQYQPTLSKKFNCLLYPDKLAAYQGEFRFSENGQIEQPISLHFINGLENTNPNLLADIKALEKNLFKKQNKIVFKDDALN